MFGMFFVLYVAVQNSFWPIRADLGKGDYVKICCMNFFCDGFVFKIIIISTFQMK